MPPLWSRSSTKCRAPETQCPPPHPVHAEGVVEQAADERRQPGDPHPRDGGADIALVEKDMNGDAARDGNMCHRGQLTDIPGEVSAEGHWLR